MTALAAARIEPKFEQWDERKVPLAATIVVWAGAMVCLDTADGMYKIGVNSTTLINVGIAQESVDSTGTAAGATLCNIKFHRPVKGRWFKNDPGGGAAVAANRGSDCYILDDQTVTMTSTTASKAGRVWEVATIDGASCVFVEPFSGSL